MSLIKLTADNIDSLYQLRLQRRLDEKASKQSKTITYEQLKAQIEKNREEFIENERNNDTTGGKFDFINNYQLEPMSFSDDDLTSSLSGGEEDHDDIDDDNDDDHLRHQNTARDINQLENDSDAISENNNDLNRIDDDLDEYQRAMEQEISEVNNNHYSTPFENTLTSHGGDAPTPSRPSSGIVRAMVKSRPQTGNNSNNNNEIGRSVFRLTDSRITSKQTKDQVIESCTLGKGKYSTIIKAKHQVINTCVAVKVIPTNSLTNGKLKLQLAHNEAILLSRLRHPNIARLYQSFRIEWEPVTNGAAALIVLELATQGSLRSLVQEYYDSRRHSQDVGLNFDFCQNIIAQLVSAVIHINDRNIIHRNITPENILLSRQTTDEFGKNYDSANDSQYLIKLIGFDTAILAKSKQFLPPLGLNNFNSPPEVMDNNFNPNYTHDNKIDVWSIGCIAYYLLTGKEPKFNSINGSLENSSRNLLANLQTSGIISKPAIELIEMCLITNLEDRAQICELETCQFIQESYYKPPKRNVSSATKKHFLEILGAHLNISAKSLSKRCHEQRFDELSAMYNLLLDAFGTQVSAQIQRQNEEKLDLELIKKNFSDRAKRARSAGATIMRTNSKDSAISKSEKESIRINLETQGRPSSHYAKKLYRKDESDENIQKELTANEVASQEILYTEASYHNGFGLRRPKTASGRLLRSPQKAGPNKLTPNRTSNNSSSSSSTVLKKQSIPITSQNFLDNPVNEINAVNFRYLQADIQNLDSSRSVKRNDRDPQNQRRAQSAYVDRSCSPSKSDPKSEKILKIPSKLNFDISTLRISSKAIPVVSTIVNNNQTEQNTTKIHNNVFRKKKKEGVCNYSYSGHKSINRVDNAKASKNSNSMKCQSMLSYKSLQMFEEKSDKVSNDESQLVSTTTLKARERPSTSPARRLGEYHNSAIIINNITIVRKNSLEIGDSIQKTLDKSRQHTKSSRKKITQPINPKSPKNQVLSVQSALDDRKTSIPISRNFKKNHRQYKNEASFPKGIDGRQLMKRTVSEYQKITEGRSRSKIYDTNSSHGPLRSGQIRARSAGVSTNNSSRQTGSLNVQSTPIQLNYMKIQKLGNFK